MQYRNDQISDLQQALSDAKVLLFCFCSITCVAYVLNSVLLKMMIWHGRYCLLCREIYLDERSKEIAND